MNSGDLIQRLKEEVEDRIVNRYKSAGAKDLARKYLIPLHEGVEVRVLDVIEEASSRIQRLKEDQTTSLDS